MSIRRLKRSRLGVAIAALGLAAGCDEGSRIPTGDWRALEQRLTVLEEDNAVLRAELDKAVTEEDLAGYATVDQCGACVQPEELSGYAKTEDLPDLSGYATTAELAGYARTEDLPDLGSYALKSERPDLSG